MQVLVTGGAGYIGSQVVLRLSEQGHAVTALDNFSTGYRQVPPVGNFVEGDVRDPGVVTATLAQTGAEAVLHMAALSDLRESVRDPLNYYDNNVTGTLNVVEKSVAAGVKYLVFSSSAAVYGKVQDIPVAETSPLQPISPYGRTKLIGEQILTDTSAAHDFNHVALRFFNVAGADPEGRCGESMPQAWHLIKVACQAALGMRDGITINGIDHPTEDGTCIRDYVHVDDVAQAHIRALDYLAAGGASQAFNVGYGRGASVKQIVDLVSAVSEIAFEVRTGPAVPGDPPSLVASAKKIRQVLGWTPEYDDLNVIIRSALTWEVKMAATRRKTE